jgi:hypothetical protein
MLRSNPTAASATTRLDPPADTNGSGIPVSGARPRTAAMLMIACPQMSVVSATARRLPKGSLHWMAML